MARGTCSHALDETISTLVERSIHEDRWIMAFSEHELIVVNAYCSPMVSEAFSTRFRNAKVLIDRWAKSRPSWRKKARDLETYCILAGLTPPESPKGGVAETLRRLARRMDGKRRWGSLPRVDRDDGVALLDYNARDCRCLQQLTIRAVNYLSTRHSAQAA
ncbi:MAG: hypothetical protein V2J02_12065 [Pseudomonadales bacterium]|jgi:hypothetical protein|nr:hypothetical protein [Pseudomonadales bacterium]